MPNVEIPEEVVRQLAEVKKNADPRKVVFKPWQDEVLRKYWNHKDYTQANVAKIIGRAINTCKARYEELMSAEQADTREPTTEPDTGHAEGVQRGRHQEASIHRAGDTAGAA